MNGECVCGDPEPVEIIREYVGPAKRRRRVPCSACREPILRGEDVHDLVFKDSDCGVPDRDVAHVDCLDLVRRGTSLVCDQSGWILGTTLDDVRGSVLTSDEALKWGWIPSDEVREFVIAVGDRYDALEARKERGDG